MFDVAVAGAAPQHRCSGSLPGDDGARVVVWPASRPKPAKLVTNLRLRGKVEHDLAKRYSPEQIAGRLKVEAAKIKTLPEVTPRTCADRPLHY